MSSAKALASRLLGDPSNLGEIYRAFRAAADQGKPAPSNQDLADRIGAMKVSSIPNFVRKLVELGAIRNERAARTRRVTIVATGRSTWVPDTFRPVTAADYARRGRKIAAALADRATTKQLAEALPENSDEALRSATRRALARCTGTVKNPVPIDRPTPELREAPPADADRRPMAPSREPCPRCAIRGDLGCKHFAPFEPMMEDA